MAAEAEAAQAQSSSGNGKEGGEWRWPVSSLVTGTGRSAWEKQQTDFGAAKSGKQQKYLGGERMPIARHGCTEQSA